MLREHPAVVPGVCNNQDHHSCPWIIAHLEREAALQLLDVVEVDFALDRRTPHPIGEAFVPGAQVPRQRQPRLANCAERWPDYVVESCEHAKVSGIAQPGTGRVELQARSKADDAGGPTDQRERWAAKLSPLKPAELGSADTRAGGDGSLAHARGATRGADLATGLGREPPCIGCPGCGSAVAGAHGVHLRREA